jgi:hypothetical protein
MAKLIACAACGATVDRYSPKVFTLKMDEPNGGPCIELAWCSGVGGRRCAETDPLHLQLAAAQGLPDGQEGDDAICTAYLRILDHIGTTRGARGLRAAVDVRRDVADLAWTMRGPGLLWGSRVEIV